MENSITTTSQVSRRSFLLGVAATGAGIACTLLPHTETLAETLFALNDPLNPQASFEPNVWVRVDPDGTTTITVAKSEMGQGVRTSLAMIVAEEMDADWAKVKIRQARPDTGNGSLGTGGSGSVMGGYSNLRRPGATVRAMFISAAAKQWGIAESACTASKGVVIERNGSRKLSYGELTDAAATIPVPTNPTLKNVANFTLIGTKQPHIDNPDIVTGKAIYGLDVRIPGMKFALLAMPPTLGASVRTVDNREALKIPGVLRAERVNGVPGVVVIAENTYAAMRGRDALIINWNLGNNTGIDSTVISERMRSGIGTVPDVPASSAIKIQAEYELPYLAHATMEPMNCVADVKSSSAEIWCPTQVGDSVLSTVASATGLPSSAIRVNTTLLGGGFGRRLTTDYANYAARISAFFKMPVMFMYTRQDDMKNDYYRPASYHVVKGGLTADGQITGWNQRAVPNGVAASPNPPYNVTASAPGYGSLSSPVPTAAWRSVSHTSAVFVNECFIDELAVAAGKDPYQFRRGLLPAGRLRTVLDEAATRAEWTKPLPKGWGRGIACTDAYSYIAHVVEVSFSDSGVLKVERVVAVVDCGVAINPMGVEAQIQGACVDALSTALKAAITIEKGAVKQSTYADYEWLRMNEMPKIEVHILPSTQPPRGMGEAGFPSVSPALCNAIFNATGKRIRTLPIQKSFPTDVDIPALREGGEMKVYPNPFSSSFRIEGRFSTSTGQQVTMVITNLLGSRLVEATTSIDANGEFSAHIELPPSADGVYLLTVRNGSRVLTQKIVKG